MGLTGVGVRWGPVLRVQVGEGGEGSCNGTDGRGPFLVGLVNFEFIWRFYTSFRKDHPGRPSSSLEQAQKDASPCKLDSVKPVDKGPHRKVLMVGWAC